MESVRVVGTNPITSGAPIRKLTDVPITDILTVIIPDIDTDTDN